MTTSPSEPTCRRCGRPVYKEDSVWCLRVWVEGPGIRHDIVRTSNIQADSTVLHVRGDRECRSEMSGFIGKIIEELGSPEHIPETFLRQL